MSFDVVVFVDPKAWNPIAPGTDGFAKKAPIVCAEIVDALERHRGQLGFGDPTVPRRRAAAQVRFDVADRIEDLPLEDGDLLGRRVTMEEIWAIGLALVLDGIEAMDVQGPHSPVDVREPSFVRSR